jgi:histidinol-phosphate aminotransferase
MTRRAFPREDYATLTAYDPGRRPVEVDLSDNTNLWGPSPAAMAVLQGAQPDQLSRYPSVYAGDLKESVSRLFGVPEENVTTGCGSDGLLDAAFRASTLPPGGMSYPGPSFSMVEAFARMNGLEARSVPWSRAMENPGKLLQGGPALVYLCSPNNPTGATVSRSWLEDLLAAVGERGPLVILDEAYADFSDDSFLQDAVASERLLVLRTMSKLYGLAGLRVGFGVGPKPLVTEVEKSRGPYQISQLSETAAVAALEDPSGWREDIVVQTVTNRERLRMELEARGLKPLPSSGNFLLLPVEPADPRAVNNALRAGGVAVRPFPHLPEVGGALRVSIGPWSLMARFLAALDAVLSGQGLEEGPFSAFAAGEGTAP